MPFIAPILSAILGSTTPSAVDELATVSVLPVYSAALRSFPADAKKGELLPPLTQSAVISGQIFNVSPGLQIRNQQNLIIMPNTQNEIVPIRYQLDLMGNVWRVWILSAAEQAAPDLKK
jgi:hypothetical protein